MALQPVPHPSEGWKEVPLGQGNRNVVSSTPPSQAVSEAVQRQRELRDGVITAGANAVGGQTGEALQLLTLFLEDGGPVDDILAQAPPQVQQAVQAFMAGQIGPDQLAQVLLEAGVPQQMIAQVMEKIQAMRAQPPVPPMDQSVINQTPYEQPKVMGEVPPLPVQPTALRRK